MLAPTGLITTGVGGGDCGEFHLAKTQCGIALDSWQAKARSGVNASLGSFPLSAVNTSCTTGMTEAPEQPEQYRWGVSCAFGMQTHKEEKSGAGGSFAAFYVSFRSNNSGSIDAQLTIYWQHHDLCTEPPPKVAVYQRTISRCPTCENGDIVSFGPSHYICGTKYCGTDATYKFKAYCDCGTPKTKSGTGSSTSTETYTFPADERCMWFSGGAAVSGPITSDEKSGVGYGDVGPRTTFSVKVGGTEIWNSGAVWGAATRCFQKPEGVTSITVEVTPEADVSVPNPFTPPPTNITFSAVWGYSLECDACPPPAVAPPCCRDRGAVCDGGVTVRYCSPAPPPDTSPCANSSSLPECNTATCTETGVNPSFYPPYDCVNGAFRFGAFVSVSGWSSYSGDTSGLSDDDIALIAEVNALANQAFFVPFTCFGTATKTFDLGLGFERDTEDCSGAHWFADVSVNLCARTASVNVRNLSCYDGTNININLSDLTAITVPCNSWTGCNCAGYADDIPLVDGVYGGGTLTVYPFS